MLSRCGESDMFDRVVHVREALRSKPAVSLLQSSGPTMGYAARMEARDGGEKESSESSLRQNAKRS
jgi:hypothetical protein